MGRGGRQGSGAPPLGRIPMDLWTEEDRKQWEEAISNFEEMCETIKGPSQGTLVASPTNISFQAEMLHTSPSGVSGEERITVTNNSPRGVFVRIFLSPPSGDIRASGSLSFNPDGFSLAAGASEEVTVTWRAMASGGGAPPGTPFAAARFPGGYASPSASQTITFWCPELQPVDSANCNVSTSIQLGERIEINIAASPPSSPTPSSPTCYRCWQHKVAFIGDLCEDCADKLRKKEAERQEKEKEKLEAEKQLLQDKHKEGFRDYKHKKSRPRSGGAAPDPEEKEVREEEIITGTEPGSPGSEISSGAEEELERLMRELQESKAGD